MRRGRLERPLRLGIELNRYFIRSKALAREHRYRKSLFPCYPANQNAIFPPPSLTKVSYVGLSWISFSHGLPIWNNHRGFSDYRNGACKVLRAPCGEIWREAIRTGENLKFLRPDFSDCFLPVLGFFPVFIGQLHKMNKIFLAKSYGKSASITYGSAAKMLGIQLNRFSIESSGGKGGAPQGSSKNRRHLRRRLKCRAFRSVCFCFLRDKGGILTHGYDFCGVSPCTC